MYYHMNCLNCGNSFSLHVIIDGRERNLQNRKYCLQCSPFGAHNTRNVGMCKDKHCIECGKPCGRRRNRCNTCNVTRFRQNVKRKLVEYKGGKCVLCDYSRCIQNLVFHHRDPSKKEFGITGQTKSFDRMKVEVDKCTLLCCRCHGEVHAGLVSIPE